MGPYRQKKKEGRRLGESSIFSERPPTFPSKDLAGEEDGKLKDFGPLTGEKWDPLRINELLEIDVRRDGVINLHEVGITKTIDLSEAATKIGVDPSQIKRVRVRITVNHGQKGIELKQLVVLLDPDAAKPEYYY